MRNPARAIFATSKGLALVRPLPVSDPLEGANKALDGLRSSRVTCGCYNFLCPHRVAADFYRENPELKREVSA